jgi:sugar O-acyltransferase (sialic acid O-acetyltransferase NeuD family)
LKDIVIVGAGGFGRETALMIDQMQSWRVVGFYDDALKPGTKVADREVVGSIAALNHANQELAVVIAIADPMTRQRIAVALTNEKLNFPMLVHPTAMVGHPSNKFGKGCILAAGVILTTGITLGDFVIVNLATTIGHDVYIGKYSSVMPQCSVSGNVRIEERCFVGSGSRILQGLTLGVNSIMGAGAVLTKNFDANSTLIGIPARKEIKIK